MLDGLRCIDINEIIKTVAGLCVRANTCIGADIRAALSEARSAETYPLAQSALDVLLENADIAEREKIPVCQDTGMVVVFVSIGRGVHINGDINAAINEGVRQGYKTGYLRNSVVGDPISRVNTGDNTPAIIHYDFTSGDELSLTVMPKGFGSENMSALRMFEPSDGIEQIEDFIVETVKLADANPCPPIIIGAGIGGTMEKAAVMSKQALLRKVGSIHADPFWAGVEKRLFERINLLNIGAAGYGGKTTVLAVYIMTYPTHIAGLPVAVNIGCHVTRHQTAVL